MAYNDTTSSDLSIKVTNFRSQLGQWVAVIQTNPSALAQIVKFYHSDDVKLTKKEFSIPGHNFSLLRLKDCDAQPVFRIVNHEQVGFGGLANVKIAFPVHINADSLRIDTRLPLALKILRYGNDDAGDVKLKLPTDIALNVLGELYPNTFAYEHRPTISKKSFYPKKSQYHGRDLHSNLKKYLCTPLFAATELLNYFTANDTKQLNALSESDVILIALGILEEVRLLHARQIVHRDIKLDNILVNNVTKAVYLIDYDLSATEGKMYWAAGTPNYISPQHLATIKHCGGHEIVSFNRDIYALTKVFQVILQPLPPTSEVKNFLLNVIRLLQTTLITNLDLKQLLGNFAPTYAGIQLPPKNEEQFGEGSVLSINLTQ